jgi:hypothetical protein
MHKVENRDGRAGERGAIPIKVVIMLVVVVVVVFTLVKVVPVYFEQQQVEKEVDDLARQAAMGLSVYSGDKIRAKIEQIRKDFNLPEGSINLASQGDNRAQIKIKYNVPIDFVVTTYTWQVDYTADGKGL